VQAAPDVIQFNVGIGDMILPSRRFSDEDVVHLGTSASGGAREVPKAIRRADPGLCGRP
jgi:hypothetical protein